jgi:hypothetical protein
VFLISTESTSIEQLLKLPVLFEHFAEHQQRDPRVNLAAFLSMHYWGHDLDDNDNDRDMQLPFKKVNINTQQVLYARFTKVPQIIAAEQTVPAVLSVYKDQYHPTPSLTSPFRPPCA